MANEFNGDGEPDLIWHNAQSGMVTVWYVGGAQGNLCLGWNPMATATSDWNVVAVADLNGDGKPDLVWENSVTAGTVWYMGGAEGTQFLGWNVIATTTPGWSIVGANDLNGDGKPDLIWQNSVTGVATVYMGARAASIFWDGTS